MLLGFRHIHDIPRYGRIPRQHREHLRHHDHRLEARALVTLGWNAQDILYALDLTPVGQPKYTYGADDNGVMPWAQDYFDADKTTLFDMPASGEPPIESIASLTPDVILAPYEASRNPSTTN